MTDDAALLHALALIQERGAIGETSLERAVAHADQYAARVPRAATDAVDLGSGGGLPGLVIAVRCPWLHLTLVERRTKRADLLRRAVSGLDLAERVAVVGDDVKKVADARPASFDVVTARSFAAPTITLRWASTLLRAGGVLLVSEPPGDDPERWPTNELESRGLEDLGREQGIRTFRRR
ncbi:MAG: putative ribosomal small subunit methyltransferase [Actinomycetota bacterium]|jgi:16S rRNA (guanine527-N7)-methyltransferase